MIVCLCVTVQARRSSQSEAVALQAIRNAKGNSLCVDCEAASEFICRRLSLTLEDNSAFMPSSTARGGVIDFTLLISTVMEEVELLLK